MEGVELVAVQQHLAARGLCAGRIAYTAEDIPFDSQTLHAVAVRP